MTECQRFIEKIVSLNLSFEESIYAIAFDLEDEIRWKGSKEVFNDLSEREKMVKNVQEVMGRCNDRSRYVLCRALGVVGCDESTEAEMRGQWNDFDYYLKWAIETLRKDTTRLILAGGPEIWKLQGEKKSFGVERKELPTAPVLADFGVEDLHRQVEQLMDEVRFYDQKRDQALIRIETLLSEIKTLEGLTTKMMTDKSREATISSDGSITQLPWSYRSRQVLEKLKIDTVAEAVEYFADFEHFVESEEITLLEWGVITSILRRENLLPTKDVIKVSLDTKLEDLFELVVTHGGMPIRVYNCLKRGGYNNASDLVRVFEHGADEGWGKLARIRNLGRGALQFLIEQMHSWAFDLSPELCYPTEQSSIEALELSSETLSILNGYQIKTIGELKVACVDENRFRGLCYINRRLYNAAVAGLEACGFAIKS